MKGRDRFDRGYYERYYGKEKTRVTSPEETERLCRFVHAYLDFLGLAPRTVLDIGCGLGWWRTALLNIDGGIVYTGVEASAHLCEQLGWVRGSVVDYESPEPFDLVVCQGVLQYLPDHQARRAVKNLGRLADKALYLEVLTRRDWEENVDRETTDGDVHRREGYWYRRLLHHRFLECGGGLFVRKDAGTCLLELEHFPEEKT